MNISLKQLLKWLIVTLIFPLVFLNGWLIFRFFQYFQPLVTIFVLATLLAFILNYPVSLLEKQGVRRKYGVALVFVLAVVILVVLGITLLPVVLDQFNEVANLLPQWIDSSQEQLQRFNNLVINQNLKINLGGILTRITDKLPEELEYFSDRILSIIIDTIDSISEAIVTVVLTFYLLLDGPRLWESILKKLPLSFTKQVSLSIQQNFQNYLIGQGTLALLMGVSQTLLFLVFQVQFGLLFGFSIGVLSLIPFGDVAGLILITLIIASHNFWLAVKVLAVAVIIDQLIDQAIAPRLLGSLTGLRPLWVIVALLVGTYISGLLGLVIAVPLAGFIKDAIAGFSESNYSPDIIEGKEVSEMLTNESTS
ncbi:AI-2E family transporter [Nostocaceae cyanobacterium CENA369]|uniref:AI-2E family transporter n=1 Tax=Dendronalium phyllosphericum CENA369 TaxID=1725256 RepID=A0A8J7I7S2_9NOST|nr:AI-2E family transporter [Dendronalium phyllosphericum]MBH8577681.1 AI-2E family transporter [Dendronalium phyllosphericum CENA369]